MPLTIKDLGRDNAVSVSAAVRARCNGVVLIEGSGNVVEIGEGATASDLRITLGSRCDVRIGGDCHLSALEIYAKAEAAAAIGANCGFTHHTRVYLHEPGKIMMGSDCLVASGTLLMNSDVHLIFDLETGRRINSAKDVRIGERVWLGADAAVLKGATVGAGSVIGFRSVVTGDIPENSLAVGSPAKVVRSGIRWER